MTARTLTTHPETWRLPALLLAAVAGFYLWKGLPAPDVDDLFFLGAPLHLVNTGELANPLLRHWAAGFNTDRYFLQMPLQPHLMAGWLKVFGVSVPAVLSFAWAGYGVGAFGLHAFLRRFGCSTATVLWLLPIYLTLMVWLGQRPDATAFALLFAGLGLLDAGRAGAWLRGTAGFTLLGASALCYPTAVFWAASLVAAEIARAASQDGRPWAAIVRRWLPALGVALALVAGGFVVLVRGEVREFLRVFLAHRALRAAPVLPALVRGLLSMNKDSLALPVFILYPALAGWTVFARGVTGEARALVLGTFAASALGVVTYYALNARVGFLLGFFVSAMAVAGTLDASRPRAACRLGALVLFCVAGTLWFVQTALQHAPAASELTEARAQWQAESPGRTLFLDAAAARYLFDYRLPDGALDLFYADLPPGAAVAYVPGERGVLWAAARPWLRYVRGVPPPVSNYHKYALLGRPLDTLPRDPFEIVIIAER